MVLAGDHITSLVVTNHNYSNSLQMGSSIPRTPPGRKVTFYTVPSVAPSLHHHGILVYCCNSVIIRNPLPAESYKTIKGFDVFFSHVPGDDRNLWVVSVASQSARCCAIMIQHCHNWDRLHSSFWARHLNSLQGWLPSAWQSWPSSWIWKKAGKLQRWCRCWYADKKFDSFLWNGRLNKYTETEYTKSEAAILISGLVGMT